MADIEQRVTNLENRVRDLEISIRDSLAKIEVSLAEISSKLETSASNGDLKNELIEKDVRNNTKEIETLKATQNKIVWTIVLAVIGLIGKTVVYYIQNNMP